MLIKEKVEQAKELLREFKIDCWLTFVRESQINGDPILKFLVNGDVTWHSAFIFDSSGTTEAIVGQYDVKSIEETGVFDHVTGYVQGIREPLQKYLKELKPKNIAINFSRSSEVCDGLTYGMFLTLYEYLEEIEMESKITSAERIVTALRERKSALEIEYIKGAVKNTEEIFDLVSEFIKPGKTEKQIASFMKEEVRKRGLGFAWDEAVCPAVFTGPDGGEAHYSPTDKVVEKGHVLNMDFGVRYNGYVSDMQRTFYILDNGETEAPPEVTKGFDTIVEAVQKAKDAIKPTVEGCSVDKVARDVVVNAGYEEFPHGLGHQLGIYSHDGTALLGPEWEKYGLKPFYRLEEGMVFTIEPRLTVPGRGIVTIEEMVQIQGHGAEWLSTPQKELILIKS